MTHGIKHHSLDKLSIIDLISLIKSSKKEFLIFILIGGIIGGYFGKISAPLYQGEAIIHLAEVSNKPVFNVKNEYVKWVSNYYFDEKLSFACNPEYKINKSSISKIPKITIDKENLLVTVIFESNNKDSVITCLNSFLDNINYMEQSIYQNLIQKKYNEIERKKNILKRLGVTKNIASLEIDTYIRDQIEQLEIDLSEENTHPSNLVTPIIVTRKTFPSFKNWLSIGLFLGFCLGILFIFLKKVKFNFLSKNT